MREVWRIILALWQGPQNILGDLLALVYRDKERVFKVSNRSHEYQVVIWSYSGGLSLGDFVFVSHSSQVPHELGHSKQSRLLGPLYLVVIGLPSLAWNIFYRLAGKRLGLSYTWFYTEAWAERWGKV